MTISIVSTSTNTTITITLWKMENISTIQVPFMLITTFIMMNVFILWKLLTQQKESCDDSVDHFDNEDIGVGDKKSEITGSNIQQLQKDKTVNENDNEENKRNDKNHLDELDEHEKSDCSRCSISMDSNHHHSSPVTLYNGMADSLLTQMELTPPDCSVNSIVSHDSSAAQGKETQNYVNSWASNEEIKSPSGTKSQSGIVKIPNEKCKNVDQEILKRDLASNHMTTTEYRKKKHENFTNSSHSTDDTDFTLTLADIEPLYLDDIYVPVPVDTPLYHNNTKNDLQHDKLKESNTHYGFEEEQAFDDVKEDALEESSQHSHTEQQNLQQINDKESSKNSLKSSTICLESADKQTKERLSFDTPKVQQWQRGKTSTVESINTVVIDARQTTKPAYISSPESCSSQRSELTVNVTTEPSQKPLDKEKFCGASLALTNDSILKITKMISDFLTTNQSCGTFYGDLWVPLWRCINEQQGFDRKDLRWKYCKSTGAGGLGRNFWFTPPYSNLGSKGEIGIDYFTTEEAVVAFLMRDLDFTGSFAVSRCILDEFKMKLSQAMKEHLPFDEIHLTSNGETRRRIKKRKLLDDFYVTLPDFHRDFPSNKRNRVQNENRESKTVNKTKVCTNGRSQDTMEGADILIELSKRKVDIEPVGHDRSYVDTHQSVKCLKNVVKNGNVDTLQIVSRSLELPKVNKSPKRRTKNKNPSNVDCLTQVEKDLRLESWVSPIPEKQKKKVLTSEKRHGELERGYNNMLNEEYNDCDHSCLPFDQRCDNIERKYNLMRKGMIICDSCGADDDEDFVLEGMN